MLSAYVTRYLRATWTEKKLEERNRRRRRAWEDMSLFSLLPFLLNIRTRGSRDAPDT